MKRRQRLGQSAAALAVIGLLLVAAPGHGSAAGRPRLLSSASSGTKVGIQVLPRVSPTTPTPSPEPTTTGSVPPTSPAPTVAPPPAGPGSGALPTTGTPGRQIALEALIGLAVLGTGVWLVRIASRRRDRRHT